MSFYATYRDYCRVNKIGYDQPTEKEKLTILSYLKTAVRAIDSATRRHFLPDYALRAYQIPMTYIDLRARLLVFDDLVLDDDLLEPMFVRTGSTSLVDTLEKVPAGGLTSTASSWVAQDVDGADEYGNERIDAGTILQIDDERMLVLSADSVTNVVVVQRGVLDTEAAAHTAGTVIDKLSLSAWARGIDYLLLSFNTSPKFALRPVMPNAWGGGPFGSAARFRSPQVYIAGWWGYHEGYPGSAWVNTLETVPTGGLTATATTFTVSDADARDDQNAVRFEEGYLLRVDDELMEVTHVNETTNVVTVLRGRRGTLAQAHVSGRRIWRWQVQSDIVEAAAALAKTWREADESVGGRQGVSEMSQGVEIQVPAGIVGMLNRYVRALL